MRLIQKCSIVALIFISFVVSSGVSRAAPTFNIVQVRSVDDVDRLILALDHTRIEKNTTLAAFNDRAATFAKLVANTSASSALHDSINSKPSHLVGDMDWTAKPEDLDKLQDWLKARGMDENLLDISRSENKTRTLVLGESDHRLRYAAIQRVFAYIVRPELPPEYRRILLFQMARTVDDEGLCELYDLVMVQLQALIVKDYEDHLDENGGRFIREMYTSLKSNDGLMETPTEAFSSLAIGLYRGMAPRHRIYLGRTTIIDAENFADRVRLMLYFLPCNGTIQQLAFPLDGTLSDRGFFQQLYPEGTAKPLIRAAVSPCVSTILLNWRIDQLDAKVDKISVALTQLQQKVSNMNLRLDEVQTEISEIEREQKHLWDAIHSLAILSRDSIQMHSDPRLLKPPPNSEASSGLTPDQEATLLQAVAPVLLTDLGTRGRSVKKSGDKTMLDLPGFDWQPPAGEPNSENFIKALRASPSEPIVSPGWLVSNWGLTMPDPGPHAPGVPANWVPQFPGNQNCNLQWLVTGARGRNDLRVNMWEFSPARNGREYGKFPGDHDSERALSMIETIKRGEGVFGIVQHLGDDQGPLYSVQYYMFLPYNAATIAEIDTPFGGKSFNHAGDWLCVDLTVCVMQGDVGNPLLMNAFLHNHGRVIEVEYSAMQFKDQNHMKVYVEWGCNEAQPLPGGQGATHTEVPGIHRNGRIWDSGLTSELNDLFEYLTIRPHYGDGFEYDLRGTVTDGQKSRPVVKNLRDDGDDECKFIRAYEGRWGRDDDSPVSPYWNGKMIHRDFDRNFD